MDGTDVAAWIKQVGIRDPEMEKKLRARMPKAGARLIVYGSDGKTSPEEGEQIYVSYASWKFWRGYYLVVLIEQRTGIPLVWELRDAAEDEARALRTLIWRLRELWPDCPLEIIVGDTAWDEKWAVRWCLEHGLWAVFRRHPSLRETTYSLTYDESHSIAYFNGEGRAFCRQHHQELQYSTADRDKRRLRLVCPSGCGKLSLPMNYNWAVLGSKYPMNPVGRPDLHAMRLALLARRNSCEALFSALKVGNKLGLRGADRTRLPRFETVQALTSIALMFRTAFVLAALRLENEDMPERPPDPLDQWV
jgi:hypothetical protein